MSMAGAAGEMVGLEDETTGEHAALAIAHDALLTLRPSCAPSLPKPSEPSRLVLRAGKRKMKGARRGRDGVGEVGCGCHLDGGVRLRCDVLRCG